MVGLRVQKDSISAGAPFASTWNLIFPGGGVPFTRPTEMRISSAFVMAPEFAGLPMNNTCTGSAPSAFGPVHVTALGNDCGSLIGSGPEALVMQRSMELVAPPLRGAPVT